MSECCILCKHEDNYLEYKLDCLEHCHFRLHQDVKTGGFRLCYGEAQGCHYSRAIHTITHTVWGLISLLEFSVRSLHCAGSASPSTASLQTYQAHSFYSCLSTEPHEVLPSAHAPESPIRPKGSFMQISEAHFYTPSSFIKHSTKFMHLSSP